MSDGAGKKKKKKLKLVSNSARGTPSASRAGSPIPNQGGTYPSRVVQYIVSETLLMSSEQPHRPVPPALSLKGGRFSNRSLPEVFPSAN